MAFVAVEKVTEKGPRAPSLIDKLETMAERVRERAYEIFQSRGTNGREIEDWLQAERDLIFKPDSDLIERDGKFEIRVAAPGFKAAETSVTATPGALIVSAKSSHKHEEKNTDVHFCEF